MTRTLPASDVSMAHKQVLRDPHHGSTAEWGWDGKKLFHRTAGMNKWVEVKRVSFTPARIITIAKLLTGGEW